MNFIFPVYIKSLDRVYYFKEFNILDYKEFQKIITNKNYQTLNDFISETIEELCSEDIDSKELSFIERVKTILIIYSYSVDQDKVFYSYESSGRTKIIFNVYTILDCFEINEDSKVFNFENFEIVLGGLNSEYSEELEIYDFLKSVKIDDQIYNYDSFNRETFEKIINSIKGKDFNELMEYVRELIDINSKKELIKFKDKDGESVELSFVYDKKSIFKLVTSLMEDSLTEIYKDLFSLNQVLEISLNDLKTLTQREAKIFIQLHNKRMEEQNQEDNKSKSKTPSVNF